MIPVVRANEPTTFDRKVRQPGLSAIDELVGRNPRRPHPGSRRKKIANREDEIPPDKFPPFWRGALQDMLKLYERRCAFLALYLEYGIGSPSVDHMIPKSKSWNHVYEWTNYRLCAAQVNAYKKDLDGLIDPFTCKVGWFGLEFVAFQVISGPAAPATKRTEIEATLALLNHHDFLRLREEYVTEYEKKNIGLRYLERRAPFIAHELRRQGRLNPDDQ